MHLSQKDLADLKKPFGVLIPDSTLSKEIIQSTIGKSQRIVTVGDATTERIISFGIAPDLVIVDGKERRFQRPYPSGLPPFEVECENPAGTISDQAIGVIQKAFCHLPSTILVHGEEDLLLLPAVLFAPIGSLVLYGQPSEGIVAVTVTQEKKNSASEFVAKIR